MTHNSSRVVHVTTAHPVTDNRIYRKECVCLVQAGFDVHLVAVADADHVTGGVQVVALPRRSSRYRRMLFGAWDAWRALKSLHPDIVHVHDPELIPLAIVWRWRHHAAAVYDAHEDLPKQVMGKHYLPRRLRPPVAKVARLLEVAADRWLDGVVAATPAIARNYRRTTVTLVQNFPWLRDYPEVTPLEASCATIAYVGGIAEGRGANEMLEATRASKRGAHLLLAGPVASTKLLTRIATSSSCVEYLGQLRASAIPELLSRSRIGLAVLHPLPNYVEAQATKLFEYMAAGRPFIAANFPAWRNLLEPFECGVFVDPLDVGALTAAIDALLTDVDGCRQMGTRGREALVERFSFEVEAR